MDAFLQLQFHRLRNLEFSEIYCKIRDISDELILTHDDLIDFLKIPSEGEIVRVAGRIGASTDSLFNFVMTDYQRLITDYPSDNEPGSVAQKIYSAYGYDTDRILTILGSIKNDIFERTPNLRVLKDNLVSALSEHEILYLPTYRRVELALSEENEDKHRRRRRRPKFSVATGSLHTGDIQFGLSDIQDRLTELNRDILIRSNYGYREISENIINELITGFNVSESAPIPSADELKLFFSRLQRGGRTIGPYYPFNPPNLERIYSGEGVPSDSRKFLTYFLNKLSAIIHITKEIEEPVEAFIANCNKYLSSNEPSTFIDQEAPHQRLPSVDSKYLKMDRTDLSVNVESYNSKSPISLDALSSGEKQMVSLLAKLYLYPNKKIILIDEPELSLSIDWQRQILVDVLLSPLCEQVVAITHSPFVFDNSLEPFARSLKLTLDDSPQLEPEFDGFDDEADFDA